MALSEVTTQRNGATATSGSSIATSWPAAPAQGDLMVVSVAGNGNTAPQTVPSGWALDQTNGEAGGTIWVYSKVAGASEPTTHTWTWTSGAPGRITLRASQYTGWAGTPTLDKHNGTTGISATAGPGAHGTLAAADEVVVVVYSRRGQDAGGAWSTFNNSQTDTGQSTAAASTTAIKTAMARQIVAATTDTTYTATCPADFNGQTNWAAVVVTYKDAILITGTATVAAPKAAIAASGTHTIPPATGTGAVAAPKGAIAASGVQSFNPANFPPEPEFHVFIDFDGDGVFEPADEVTADLKSGTGITWERGRSADFGADAIGMCSFTLNNVGATISTAGAYSPEVNTNLIPGRAVLVKSTYVGVERPHFYGFIQRVTPDAQGFSVTITCYDPLRRMQETDIVVPANSLIQRSARDMRIAVLEDFERGTRNLIDNPEFAANLNGWSTVQYGGTLTRITTDGPPGAAGTTCAEYVSTAANQRALAVVRLAPIYFVGQTYRLSLFLRTTSGTGQWAVGLFSDIINQITERTITATTTWTRFTITFTMPTTTTAAGLNALQVELRAVGAGTVRMGNISVTRGQALYPYAAVGTGRWPSWCGNGSFDGGALNGWFDGFTNLVANPSFEADTAGWSGEADAFHTIASGGAITRVTTGTHLYGSAHGEFATSNIGAGVHYVLPGTFKAGITYRFRMSARVTAGGASNARLGVGSQGTPSDFAESANTAVTAGAGFSLLSVAWTPSVDRSDAHLYITNQTGGTISYSIDGLSAFRRDQAASVDPFYSNTGPGGGIGSFVTSRAISQTAKYGSRSQEFVTPATVGAGRVYDFGHLGGLFVSGRPYTLIVSIRPSSSMPYRVGLGANALNGAWDETYADGTAPANEWTDVTVTWTPSADRSSDPAETGTDNLNAVLYVLQTDATARTVLVDGVRVIPESSVAAIDAVVLAHWSLPQEPDVYLPSAQLTTSALAALGAINKLTLSRHFIRPTLTSPFYQYVVGSRDDLAGKAVAESFNGNFSGFTQADVDRDSIVNILPVSYSGGTTYYSDEVSVGKYGPQPQGDIGNASFLPDSTVADVIGPALVQRYREPRARPTWERTASSAAERISQMERDLDDLLQISLPRLGLVNKKFLIMKSGTTVSKGGVVWRTSWTLEEHAY